MLTACRKEAAGLPFSLNQNSLCQLIVNAVSSVLDGNGTALASFFDDRDRLALVAAEREEEGVELLIVGLDFFNYIFLAFNGVNKCHSFSPEFSII